MKNDFKKYHSLIFDCDGVILNSNQIKSDAFYDVAKQFGDIPAKKLLKFHVENGGISRYKKFEYLISNLASYEKSKKTINDLCNEFSDRVVESLIEAEINKNLLELDGTIVSFVSSFIPSAKGWKRPNGPTTFGPFLNCINPMTFLSK